ncbi:MAG: SDR family oxidoreductase [Acidobacteriota bacterium]
MPSQPTVLITGASTGIGAVYADRFAKRGHNLVLVARDAARLKALSEKLQAETGVTVDVLRADLTEPADLAAVEQRLIDDASIGILVNNAGTAIPGGFLDQNTAQLLKLIDLNTIAPTRLAHAVAPRFAQAGTGVIINIASVVALAPELGFSVYGATKAFLLFLTQGLHVELGPKGVYVQAVLPAATRTEIWQHAQIDVNDVQGVMDAGELVDAALVGFDRRETITIPPLPDAAQWNALESARQAMLPNFGQEHAALRYRSEVPVG